MSMNSDVRQLERITKRIEEFLSQHVQRLADVLDRCSESLAQEEVVHRLMDDLQHQKKQWELERQTEALQIEQEHARLIAAWEQLEAEERRLAAQSESLRLDRSAGVVVQPPAERPGGESPSGSRGQGNQNRSFVVENPIEAATSRRQFEQLKREIRNHARRAGGAG